MDVGGFDARNRADAALGVFFQDPAHRSIGDVFKQFGIVFVSSVKNLISDSAAKPLGDRQKKPIEKT